MPAADSRSRHEGPRGGWNLLVGWATSGTAPMKLPRRNFLRLAAGAAALSVASRIARAQIYPTRPVRFIVSFPPGGSFDIIARIVGQFPSERLAQQFVVENRAGGAGGSIGMQALVNSAPDGYTIAIVGPNYAINTTLYENLPYDFLRDVAPVGGMMSVGNVMEVHPSLPTKTVAEFIAYAKAKP